MTLKSANDVQCMWEPGPAGLLGGRAKVYLQIGRRKVYSDFRLTRAEFMNKKERSGTEPEFYWKVGRWNYWRYKDKWYVEDDGLKPDEVAALASSYGLKLKKKINEAKTAVAAQRVPDGSLREFIPEQVRLTVWERDEGKCQLCGATTDLQFDHVIPVSMGGSLIRRTISRSCVGVAQGGERRQPLKLQRGDGGTASARVRQFSDFGIATDGADPPVTAARARLRPASLGAGSAP